MGVAMGDRVLIPQFGGSPVKVGEEEYQLFRDSEYVEPHELSCGEPNYFPLEEDFVTNNVRSQDSRQDQRVEEQMKQSNTHEVQR